MNPQATAGRVVHYYEMHGDFLAPPRAAIVNIDTQDDGMALELSLFNTGGVTVLTSVEYSEEPKAGCWSWMPYQLDHVLREK
ncbi:hypothetical protein LCGC14_1247760 [marine sediment metagenome]|uniref:Uncharacterized protein n=1 Tax=marine sediment metagenome TaxID=412755 RepID=A0A0F9L405_9ZZZZ